MAGSLSGTPGKVAKILLGSSERHRLATADYLASLLDGAPHHHAIPPRAYDIARHSTYTGDAIAHTRHTSYHTLDGIAATWLEA